MNSATVPVAVVTSRIEAELIVGALRSHGLRAAILGTDLGGIQPQWQQEGVQVIVAADDEAVARQILADISDEPEHG